MPRPILAAFLSCQTTQLTEEEKQLFAKVNPLGVTLFARNIQTKQQLKKLTSEIKEVIARNDVLIAVDQEGGRVRRLKEPDFRSYSAQIDIGQLPIDEAKKAASLQAELISSDLLETGINVNYAPVLDIQHPNTTEALRSRCFSDNPNTTAILGKITLESYMTSGIIPCIKHMPGHGYAVSDPHLGLPIIDIPQKQFLSELIPFQACKNSPFGMTAHILLPQFDKENPITQSAIGIKKLIREQIGFNGLLISDAIDMKALKGSITEKAQKSLDAGCDAVCYCMGNINEMLELTKTCPKLSDAAMERLDKALQILHNTTKEVNISSKATQYATLIGKVSAYKESYDATEILHQLSKGKA